MILRPPRSTLFPYRTLFRSCCRDPARAGATRGTSAVAGPNRAPPGAPRSRRPTAPCRRPRGRARAEARARSWPRPSVRERTTLAWMRVTALAGGVGAGKLLRGLVRAVAPEAVTVITNTGDDITMHGLHVSPDLDSVTYWLGGVADRDRGWGRAGETFRATEELRALGAAGSWFGLGDLDLATHLYRTEI